MHRESKLLEWHASKINLRKATWSQLLQLHRQQQTSNILIWFFFHSIINLMIPQVSRNGNPKFQLDWLLKNSNEPLLVPKL
jgi:hypothetical protein